MDGAAELVAALCIGLDEDQGPLAPGGAARPSAEAVVAAVRAGASDEILAARFADLDQALADTGVAGGLDAGAFRSDTVGYRRLPGVTARAIHTVFRCPGEPRCARLEPAGRAARQNPPTCAVHGGPLEQEQHRFDRIHS